MAEFGQTSSKERVHSLHDGEVTWAKLLDFQAFIPFPPFTLGFNLMIDVVQVIAECARSTSQGQLVDATLAHDRAHFLFREYAFFNEVSCLR
jgi:hypothetical protein